MDYARLLAPFRVVPDVDRSWVSSGAMFAAIRPASLTGPHRLLRTSGRVATAR
jgi:hypothetical protein